MVQPGALRLIGALVLAFVTAALAFPGATAPVARVETLCPADRQVRVGDTVACMHLDEAPPGVEVTERPSTTELLVRPGASEAAYEAAEELGVPSPVAANATATVPDVPCDGDGTSGYRVQAMYVVEAGRTNRYAALLDTLRLWAAGTDDVVNRSAALTGGVRNIRYVTDTVGATCVANVLNVTVPAGSTASFGATVAAVQALGHTAAGRKYLMWTDATVLCGVASMYTNDGETQANPNNGAYPQYARVDAGCWGWGDGTRQHSVEAHELLHTLGGVQAAAPHGTRAGHCWDESDAMCYADGGGFAMQQVCPPEREFFFDCNNDDYFSTFPDPGGYLDTHWNSADSRFLIGGGNGSGGGSLGSPTTLGATISVNNPVVPGLGTQASVAPALPTGRTLATVTWTAKRADCVFGSPAELQTTVTCGAAATGSTSVTAVLTDSTGATKTVTSPLTFAAGTARPITIALTAASQAGPTASVCTSASFPVRARVVDTASGQPVKGLSVAFTKQASTALTAASAGSGATALDGGAALNQSVSLTTAYTAKTLATAIYAAAPTVAVSAVPGTCAPTLTGTKDVAAVYYAEPVTVTGTLTRQVSGATVPVAGASLPVRLTVATATGTKVLALGNAVTKADGTYALAVKPTATGTVSVSLVGSVGYTAASVSLGTVTVTVPETVITAAVPDSDVGYGSPIAVSGTLRRDAGGTVTSLTGATVTVRVLKPGAASPTGIGTAKVLADGTFAASLALKVSGTLSVAYAGVAGQPAATVALGPATAGTWSTATTATASTASVLLGGPVTFIGSVSRTYAGVTSAAPSVRVSATFTPTGSSTATVLASAATTSTGAFTLKTYPKASGTWRLVVNPVIGYGGSTSAGLPLTVS